MPISYTLKAGESLALIADRYGLRDWHVIYDSPLNLPLRLKRKDPALMQPGDVFFVPDREASNTAPVEFQSTVTDSKTGALVPGITYELEVPDGPGPRKKLERDASIHGKLSVKNPDLTKGDVAILGLTDKTEPAPIHYGVAAVLSKLPTGKPNPIQLPDKRRIVKAVIAAHKISRRWVWGKQHPNYAKMDPDWDYSIVVIHHSGDSGDKDPLIIEKKHMAKWSDVGYHYLIQPSGDIFEGRHLAYKGSHVELANTGKIGILIMGDFEREWWDLSEDDPTPAQLANAAALINTLKSHFPIAKLGGHRDYKKDTECPGGEMYKLIPDLRKKTGLGGP